MASDISYHPLFDCDVREAIGWYERRKVGLGNEFREQIRQSVATVIANPERFGRAASGFRYIRLPRFPYVVLFDLDEGRLVFLGVLHTARSIAKWRKGRFES
ncbi:MAG: type II toxin-antitoxin system RelE/ParE family toxin [Pirellulales bacterium]